MLFAFKNLSLLQLIGLATAAACLPHSWNSTSSTSSSIVVNAENSPIDDDHRPGNPHGLRSDTLRITRCYCASKRWKYDLYFGYYFLWEYYNLHADSHVRLEMSCQRQRTDPFQIDDYPIPCFEPIERVKKCKKDPAGNKFCYYFGGNERKDYFFWNHQKRGIPLSSQYAQVTPKEELIEKCDALCNDRCGKLGTMEMLKGLSLFYAEQAAPGLNRWHGGYPGIGFPSTNEWSHIAFYPEVDDMCHGCRR